MPMRLSPERRAGLILSLKREFQSNFEEELSTYRAERLLEFFLKHLGPPVYNQGVQDARKFMFDKLDDLAGEIHEPEGLA